MFNQIRGHLKVVNFWTKQVLIIHFVIQTIPQTTSFLITPIMSVNDWPSFVNFCKNIHHFDLLFPIHFWLHLLSCLNTDNNQVQKWSLIIEIFANNFNHDNYDELRKKNKKKKIFHLHKTLSQINRSHNKKWFLLFHYLQSWPICCFHLNHLNSILIIIIIFSI